jgi:hypothetical protein
VALGRIRVKDVKVVMRTSKSPFLTYFHGAIEPGLGNTYLYIQKLMPG